MRNFQKFALLFALTVLVGWGEGNSVAGATDFGDGTPVVNPDPNPTPAPAPNPGDPKDASVLTVLGADTVQPIPYTMVNGMPTGDDGRIGATSVTQGSALVITAPGYWPLHTTFRGTRTVYLLPAYDSEFVRRHVFANVYLNRPVGTVHVVLDSSANSEKARETVQWVLNELNYSTSIPGGVGWTLAENPQSAGPSAVLFRVDNSCAHSDCTNAFAMNGVVSGETLFPRVEYVEWWNIVIHSLGHTLGLSHPETTGVESFMNIGSDLFRLGAIPDLDRTMLRFVASSPNATVFTDGTVREPSY